eukprot:TRINITY_DN12297_c0_g2_i2.p1 TRINITY_DN12297_c0_g2~~TRINITY_DN12297_c0_g2_i2.p1  ORF type:complete len:901 (+),score=146.73 TRINITY_DN12297_c0_g2_i2:2-2704(+)
MFRMLVLLLVVARTSADLPNNTDACYGEFSLCPDTGECSLGPCGVCPAKTFVCPLKSDDGTYKCFSNASDYVNCPHLKGTHLDWTLTIDQRLDYLVNHTTLEQRVAQLTNTAPALPDLGVPTYQWLSDDEHGVIREHATNFPDGPGLGASWDVDLIYRIGVAVGQEARGGHNGYTHSGNRAVDGYQNGLGITIYGPNLNLVRDPRWGRAQEVYSEDPCLTSKLTVGYITGVQGMHLNGTRKDKDFLQAGACCKHYVAYDLETFPIGRQSFDASVDARSMWEHYMPAFDACFNEAKAMHTMCSYNSLNGYPTCGDPGLLNHVLRDMWKWDGFVVSDYDAWQDIYSTHHFAANATEAAAIGINAGLDQEGGGTSCISELPAAIAAGMTTAAKVETSFRRLFHKRIELGMLDPPTHSSYNAIPFSVVANKGHIALTREAAGKAMCLYKNDNNTLPLNEKDYTDEGSILVVDFGAGSGTNIIGNYANPPDTGSVSVSEGLRNVLAPQSNRKAQHAYEANTTYQGDDVYTIMASSIEDCERSCLAMDACRYFSYVADGGMLQGHCHMFGASASKQPQAGYTSGSLPAVQDSIVSFAKGCANIACNDTTYFPEAVAKAQHAKTTVLVLGLYTGCLQTPACESEAHDRSSIAMPGQQNALVTAVRAASKQLVCVLVHGSGLQLQHVMDTCDAVVDAWYPGQEGGNGLADVLFGKVNPAGRSPQTHYASDDDLPPFGNMDLYAHKGITYRYFQGDVVIPFGFGLSYTSFDISNIEVPSTSAPCDDIHVAVDVTNTGDRDGDEIVQVYVKQPNASVPVPQVRLVAYTRVAVAQGQTVSVKLSFPPKSHSIVPWGTEFFNPDLTVEAGPLRVYVGNGQPDHGTSVAKATIFITSSQQLEQCPQGDRRFGH